MAVVLIDTAGIQCDALCVAAQVWEVYAPSVC